MKIEEGVLDLFEYVKGCRQHLHQIPEIAFNEYKTSDFIKKELDTLDIAYETVAKTGVIGYLDAGSKETIAFRADMDALNIEEKNDVPFKSMNKGFMHACGHDGHMAMLLGLAKYIATQKLQLNKNIMFLFQPAEEGPGGAKVIIDAGILTKYNVSEIYGIHLFPEVEEGVFALRKGPMMASVGEFYVKIKGKSAHGAIPNLGVDAIVIASHFVNQVQNIISREIHPANAGVVSIGQINGGSRPNVIADLVTLGGTIRAFDDKINEFIKGRVKTLLEGLSTSYHSDYEVVFDDMYPVLDNNEKLYEAFLEANGKEHCLEVPLQMISEDFSFYQREIPGLFIFLGTKNEKLGYVNSLHNSAFNFDEKALLNGIQGYVNLLENNHVLVRL